MNTDITKIINQLPEIKLELECLPLTDISKAATIKGMSLVKMKLNKYPVIDIVIKCIHQIESLSNKSQEKRIDKKQTLALANHIINNYHWLNIAQIRFAFMQGYTNKYPTKIFDCLEFNHFTDWLDYFENDRVKYIEENPEHKQAKTYNPKGLPEPQGDPEETKKLIRQGIEEMTRKNYEFNKKLADEKAKTFINLHEYFEYYKLPDHSLIMASINESIHITWENNPSLHQKYIVSNVTPDSDPKEVKSDSSFDLYYKSVHFKVLRTVNQYKPKDIESIKRIILNSLI